MVDKIHKSFLDATRNVFNLMLNIPEISDRPAEDFKCDNEVDIAIGIVGDLQGEVIYRFPVPTSLNIVSIISGMQFEEVDTFVTSAIAEIANIISGHVITALADNQTKLDILPPVQKDNLEEDKKYDLTTSCCIATTIGEICLEIRLNRAA
ncbi:MAG TPA: chemotaxis protein CheX [Firmicutes bacterium]|mgnify:CR=1 FL=1|jgi:chemotaxis protein CheX|nr:chemotaxis protein CheX [Bacillota bacterium]HPT68440.1 chemotaxis protein CheX [Bacillota bacterium]